MRMRTLANSGPKTTSELLHLFDSPDDSGGAGRGGEPYPVLAVGGLLVEEGRILLVRRKNPPAKGLWTLPGGRVLPGERLAEATRREFLEETSLEVEPVGLAGLFEIIDRSEEGHLRFHYVVADYWVRRVGGHPKAGSDAAELSWFPIDSLPIDEMPAASAAFVKEVLPALPGEMR
jgi:8-oxo-dGTP diphosphatase